MREVRRSAIVIGIALLMTAATCQKAAPRHSTTVNLQVLTTAVASLQDGEKLLYDAHTLPALTVERHKTFNAKLVEVWDAMDAAVVVVQAWQPGDPMPALAVKLVAKVAAFIKEALEVVNVALPEKVTAVVDALATIMAGFAGGGS